MTEEEETKTTSLGHWTTERMMVTNSYSYCRFSSVVVEWAMRPSVIVFGRNRIRRLITGHGVEDWSLGSLLVWYASLLDHCQVTEDH